MGRLIPTRQSWGNRHPDKIILPLDFESTGKKAAPFLGEIPVGAEHRAA
jgi:hypothetical protein